MAEHVKKVMKYFRKKGFDVTATKVTRDPWNLAFTHIIRMNGEEADDELAEEIYHVFEDILNCLRLADGVFAVQIPEDFMICRECGCSNDKGCYEGCWWVGDEDICSSCANVSQESADALREGSNG